MANGQNDKPAPPYLAYRTFSNYLDSLRTNIPHRIDRTVLGNMSGVVQSQLLATLRYLSLIQADGTPTARLEALVGCESEKKKEILHEILRASYPFMFTPDFVLARATPGQVHERFAAEKVQGDTIRKAVSFFLRAAREAGVALSPHLRMPRRVTRQASGRSPYRGGQSKGDSDTETSQESGGSPSAKDPILTELLAKFPTLDPSWPDEVKTKWFESFQELMRRTQEG